MLLLSSCVVVIVPFIHSFRFVSFYCVILQLQARSARRTVVLKGKQNFAELFQEEIQQLSSADIVADLEAEVRHVTCAALSDVSACLCLCLLLHR